MIEAFVPSAVITPGRRTWRLEPQRGKRQGLLVFLDAELYLQRVGAAQVLRALEDEKRIPPLASIFISSETPAARHSDYVCDAGFTRFLTEDLLPFAGAQDAESVVLIGLSLSELAAAYAVAISHRFRAAICKSPSFWWHEERFISSVPIATPGASSFWVSVGDLETESGISHPPSNPVQHTSQRDSCERASVALRAAGYAVSHRIFHGGHDPVCWRDDLTLALPWAISAWNQPPGRY